MANGIGGANLYIFCNLNVRFAMLWASNLGKQYDCITGIIGSSRDPFSESNRAIWFSAYW